MYGDSAGAQDGCQVCGSTRARHGVCPIMAKITMALVDDGWCSLPVPARRAVTPAIRVGVSQTSKIDSTWCSCFPASKKILVSKFVVRRASILFDVCLTNDSIGRSGHDVGGQLHSPELERRAGGHGYGPNPPPGRCFAEIASRAQLARSLTPIDHQGSLPSETANRSLDSG